MFGIFLSFQGLAWRNRQWLSNTLGKEQAVKLLERQLSHTDSLRPLLGFDAYPSLYYSQGYGYAEAFYESTSELYWQLPQCFVEGEISELVRFLGRSRRWACSCFLTF